MCDDIRSCTVSYLLADVSVASKGNFSKIGHGMCMPKMKRAKILTRFRKTGKTYPFLEHAAVFRLRTKRAAHDEAASA